MESQVQTIICPNCGANSSNHHHCEYCGSILVRFVDKNIDIDDKYKKEAKVLIPGLETALKSNLLIQKHPIKDCISITELKNNYGELFQVFPINEAMFGIEKPNPYTGDIGVVLRIPFYFRSTNYNVSQEASRRFNTFRAMDCFSLFDKVTVPDGDLFLLDCGEDYITASRILSNVLLSFGDTNYACATINVQKSSVEMGSNGHISAKNTTNNASLVLGVIILIIAIVVLCIAI